MNMQTMGPGLGRKLLSLTKTLSDNLSLSLSDIETFRVRQLASISPDKIFRGDNFRLKQFIPKTKDMVPESDFKIFL